MPTQLLLNLLKELYQEFLHNFLFSGNLTALKWYPVLLVCAVFCSDINNVDIDKIEISHNSDHLEFQYV